MANAKEIITNKILWFLLFSYLVVFPFGQLATLPINFGFPEIRIYFTDILVGIMGTIWLFKWFAKRQFVPFGKEMVAFGVVATFSLLLVTPLFGGREVVVSSLYLVRLVAYGMFYGAIWSLLKTTKDKKLLISSLITIGVATALFGWVQYFLFPDTRPLFFLGWDEHYKRIIGAFFDPNFTSIILVLTLVLLTFHLIERFSFGSIVLWLIVFSALMFTYSRSGYLAFLVGVFAVSFLVRKPKIFLISTLLLLFSIFILPRPGGEGIRLERIASSLARVENWKEGLILARENPLFGVGFNTLRYVRERKGLIGEEQYGLSHAAGGVDNSFLFVLTTTGVTGLLVFLGLLVKMFQINPVLSASLYSLIIHSLFSNSLFYPWVLGFLGILLVASRIKEKEQK